MATPPPNKKRSLSSWIGSSLTVALAAYGTYQLVQWLTTDDDKEEEGHNTAAAATSSSTTLRTTRNPRIRQQRIQRCRDETLVALQGFDETVRRIVDEATDLRATTKELKKLRLNTTIQSQREQELWEVIKVRSLTRYMGMAYAQTTLLLTLTVQVHLLGGRLWDEQQIDSTTNNYQESHRLVLTHTYEYFFQNGLQSLLQLLERRIALVCQDWNVMDPASLHISLVEVHDRIQRVRAVMEEGRANRSIRSRSLLRFLVPPAGDHNSMKVEDRMAQSILDETCDLLESPLLEGAQTDCLNTMFTTLQSRWEFDNLPLATILTKLKKMALQQENENYKTLQRLPSVLELADVSFN